MMRLANTTNETSFAVCIGDATALVLDAIAATGSTRREKLTFALDRLDRAIRWADTAAELTLATGLVGIIRDLEQQGMDA